ncbi:MAG: DUF1643 domain-containing protein [Flavobacteriaceae bacterium]|nr:DUF1643 domain-containing protein [Flavobacteriaceae bacterium]
MLSGAEISKNKLYRYSLYRIWNKNLPKVLFIMLNPSKADSKKNDPTLRRVINFAKNWGFGGVYVGNLHCFISTNPKEISIENKFHREKNIQSIKKMFRKSKLIIYAWGNNRSTPSWLKMIIQDPYCIELNKNGIPKHPLYLRRNLIYKRLVL